MIRIYIALVFAILLAMNNLAAQTRSFVQQKCMTDLKPFTFNGKYNKVDLNADNSAEVLVSFNSNNDYRIYICAEEGVGNVNFKLVDSKNVVLYDNKDHSYTIQWDFTTESTQLIKLEVRLVAGSAGGSVTILVGFKPKA